MIELPAFLTANPRSVLIQFLEIFIGFSFDEKIAKCGA
jgi:hypothetical protein